MYLRVGIFVYWLVPKAVEIKSALQENARVREEQRHEENFKISTARCCYRDI